MLFLLPKSMQIKVFEEIPHETQTGQLMPLSLLQKEKIVKELITLCMQSKVHHNSLLEATKLLTGSFNDVIYYKADDEVAIKPYTLIEYFHNMLLLKLVHNNQINQLYDSTIKNFFTVIDNLCLLKKIDLALPGIIYTNQSIEKFICDRYQFNKERLSNEPLSKIPLLSPETRANSIYARPPEHQYIIKALIDLFLFPDHK
jgi:hypothetical protein